MIAKLRHRHRFIFPVLGLLILVIAILGLQEKPAVSNQILPGYSNNFPKDLVEIYSNGSSDTSLLPVFTIYFSEIKQSHFISISLNEKLRAADILVYFEENGLTRLNEDSKLMGNFVDGQIYEIPSEKPNNGSIIFYSLPKKEIIKVLELSEVNI